MSVIAERPRPEPDKSLRANRFGQGRSSPHGVVVSRRNLHRFLSSSFAQNQIRTDELKLGVTVAPT